MNRNLQKISWKIIVLFLNILFENKTASIVPLLRLFPNFLKSQTIFLWFFWHGFCLQKLMPETSLKIYQPRKPYSTALYQLILENLETFIDSYDQQFYATHGPLQNRAKTTLKEYLRCGILRYGFAKITCTQCQHKMLIAFSCQKRGVCPSCCAKRIEIWGRLIQEEILEKVPHRQLVFVLPKRFRRFFLQNGHLLTKLCKAMNQSVCKFIQTGLNRKKVKPGLICCLQTFGDRLNPHVHLHVLVSEGGFEEDCFYRLYFNSKDLGLLLTIFSQKIFSLLMKEKLITPLVKEQMQSWRHCGFSIDGSVKIIPRETEKTLRLLRYMARNPVANERLLYESSTGKVTILSTKKWQGERKTVAHYNALEFLALLSLQIPPQGSHLTRYFGYYSSRSRSIRKPKQTPLPQEDSPNLKACRKRWRDLIKLVFEIDPLTCPKCNSPMKISAFILKNKEIENILWDLRIDEGEPPSTGPPKWLLALQSKEWIEENPNYFPPDFDPLKQSEVSFDQYLQDTL